MHNGVKKVTYVTCSVLGCPFLVLDSPFDFSPNLDKVSKPVVSAPGLLCYY